MKRKDFIKSSLLVGSSLSLIGSTLETNKHIAQRISYPPKLEKGATVALFAPSGAVFNPAYITKASKSLESLGYSVFKAKSLYTQNGYFSSTLDKRVDELHDLITNPKVKAIIAMRGGWGCAQLLPKLDLDLIRNNPKIIMGYSDLTSLLNYITEHTGLVTYHGLMGYSTWNEFAVSEFKAQLEQTQPARTLKNPVKDRSNLVTYSSGNAYGSIIGGNLSVIASMIGTQDRLNFKDKLLFLEETHEEPYRIDRLLYQLQSAGIFDEISGLILGQFSNCEAENPEESFSIVEVLEGYFSDFRVPAYGGASIGHVINKFILPLGARAKIDADQHYIQINP